MRCKNIFSLILLSSIVFVQSIYSQQPDSGAFKVDYLIPKIKESHYQYLIFRSNETPPIDIGGLMYNISDVNHGYLGNVKNLNFYTYDNKDVSFQTGTGKLYFIASNGFKVGFLNYLSSPYAGKLFYQGNNSGWKFQIGFLQDYTGAFQAQMTFFDNGNIAIGTEISKPYRLAVNGSIGAKAIEVTLNNWPDHILNDNYRLMSLDSLSQYIRDNNHLPGIPTEEEILKSAVDLGSMQVKLLEKIEELTLYVLQLKKENESLKNLINDSKNK